ncbi:hypothetical protein BaRGS_00003928 [Batillaria attramentaria]|uniref:Uncharacterized protein n=1 Tax=Batillaria attramentaria TaxID=370345 RepID=A0ABD0M067_9CAEN
MMPQHDLRGGRLAETEIYVNPATNEEKALSKLNQGFRFSKAQQILRLLRDQDDLNKRFRECALLDPEDEGAEGQERQPGGDPDTWSLEEEQQSEAGGSDESQHEAERRAARHVALRKHRNSIDPGRCKTSMGFYNEAEVTEIPYDTDSDNVAGLELDSAASTPRGGPYPVLSARQPNQQTYGAGGSGNSRAGNSRLRVYRLKMEEGDMNVREVAIPEECVVQSARSSRPKTSLANSSARNRYYRQQPHPEAKHQKHKQHQNASHHSNHTQHHYQQRGMGETRQAIISRLDPHHPMAVRPFCESKAAAHEETAARGQDFSSNNSHVTVCNQCEKLLETLPRGFMHLQRL